MYCARLLGFAAAVCVILAAALMSATASSRATEFDRRGHVAASCASSASRTFIASFLGAFNRGDLRALDRLVAQRPRFKFYVVSGESGAKVRLAAANRSRLISYFASRHNFAERLLLE